jgi:hypothetical protein
MPKAIYADILYGKGVCCMSGVDGDTVQRYDRECLNFCVQGG